MYRLSCGDQLEDISLENGVKIMNHWQFFVKNVLILLGSQILLEKKDTVRTAVRDVML